MNKYEAIVQFAKERETFYLYEEQSIIERAQKLRAAFPSVGFLYSLKCNSFRPVVRSVFAQGLGADAASLGEVLLASEQGLAPSQIFYSAPGKSIKDLQGALPCSTIVADSLSELERLEFLAKMQTKPVEIGLRVAPNFSFDSDEAAASKFGIDEDAAIAYLSDRAQNSRLVVTGIHVHLKSQELDADVLDRYYDRVFALAERIEKALGGALSFVNLGSGLGIPYSAKDKELDVAKLGAKLEEKIRAYKSTRPSAQIYIETGRYVVGKSGTYVTRVVDRKESRGKTYLIVQNTLNGFIRPSLARLVANYAQDAPAPCEPLFTKTDAFGLGAFGNPFRSEIVTVAGNLCTSADVVAENVFLPRLEVGDLLTFDNAGAYAAVLSPTQFASMARPSEVLLTPDGEFVEE